MTKNNVISLQGLIPKNNAEEALFTGYMDERPIFPVGGNPNKKRYKQPLTQNGFKDASTDPAQIEKWWIDNPSAMIGLATGKASGVYAIDIDVKDVDGHESLRQLEEEIGKLPHTFTVRTITGGTHLCFRVPQGVKIPCSVDRAKGIDFRGDGGYIVYADSENTKGGRYEVTKNLPMVELPLAYIEYFQTKKRTKTVVSENGFIEEGGRNTNLTKAIGMFLSLGLEGKALQEAAYFFNKQFCRPPLCESEVDSILDSIGQRDRGYAHTTIGNGQRFLGVSLQSINNWNVRGHLPAPEPRIRGKGNKNRFKISKLRSMLEGKDEDAIHWAFIEEHMGAGFKSIEQAIWNAQRYWKAFRVEKV